MTTAIIATIFFIIQLTTQSLLIFGVIEYRNTDPKHEDLITTLLFCTMILAWGMYEQTT